MKRLFLMAMLALLIPANPTGSAQDGYTFVQQCQGPNCVQRRAWRPIVNMPTANTFVPVSQVSSSVSYAMPVEPPSVSIAPAVNEIMMAPIEPMEVPVVQYSQPVVTYSQPVVEYTAPVQYEYSSPQPMQAAPLPLPRLFPRIRSQMRNNRMQRRMARGW